MHAMVYFSVITIDVSLNALHQKKAGLVTKKNSPINLNPAPHLDLHDTRILDILSGDGRISISELARKINLSKTPTQARVRRLEAEGYIVGYRAMLDPIRLGLDHVAFVEVTLSDTREAALSKFNQAAVQIGEIEQCHMIAGNFHDL